MAKISFLHTGFPEKCISPNLFVEEGLEDYPYRRGTGFFAKRGKNLYYITAKHCFKKHRDGLSIEEVAGRLRVVAEFSKRDIQSSDYVIFDKTIILRNKLLPVDEQVADMVILTVNSFKNEKQRKNLLSRAIKIPPTGNWLDVFFKIPAVKNGIMSEKDIIFSCIGYPTDGTETNVLDFKDNNDTIILQAAKFTGFLASSDYDYKLRLTNITWQEDLDGFSGSPVFLGYKNEHGKQYALAGMMVEGGSGKTYFLKINVISQAIDNQY